MRVRRLLQAEKSPEDKNGIRGGVGSADVVHHHRSHPSSGVGGLPHTELVISEAQKCKEAVQEDKLTILPSKANPSRHSKALSHLPADTTHIKTLLIQPDRRAPSASYPQRQALYLGTPSEMKTPPPTPRGPSEQSSGTTPRVEATHHYRRSQSALILKENQATRGDPT